MKLTRGIAQVIVVVLVSMSLSVSAFARQNDRDEERAGEIWFERMQDALETLNFSATFVAADPYGMQMYRWLHSVHNENLSIEVLEQLEGAPQPIVRVNNRLSYFNSVGPSYSAPGNRIVGPWPEGLHENVSRLLESYEILLAGGVRMLDSQALHVRLIPRVTDRFSYSIYIDRDTSMLLGAKTYAPDGTLLSQVILSHFDYQEQPIHELERSIADVDFPEIEPVNEQPNPLHEWRVNVPAGFTLIRQQRVNLMPMNTNADHLLFTDGMTQFSVYINEGNERPAPMRFQSLFSVVSLEQPDYSVTVVGRVPLALAETVANSVVRKPEND